MATRANICIANATDQPIWLYRHWDAYPSGCKPTLDYLTERLRALGRFVPPETAADYLTAIGRIEDESPGYAFDPTAKIDLEPTRGGTSQCYERVEEAYGGDEYRYLIWCGPGENHGRVVMRCCRQDRMSAETWADTVREYLAAGKSEGLQFLDSYEQPAED